MGSINNKYSIETLKAVESIVLDAGGHCRLDVGSRTGHAKIIVELNGQQRVTSLSVSPRNPGDAVKYKVSDIKRLLREMQ